MGIRRAGYQTDHIRNGTFLLSIQMVVYISSIGKEPDLVVHDPHLTCPPYIPTQSYQPTLELKGRAAQQTCMRTVLWLDQSRRSVLIIGKAKSFSSLCSPRAMVGRESVLEGCHTGRLCSLRRGEAVHVSRHFSISSARWDVERSDERKKEASFWTEHNSKEMKPSQVLAVYLIYMNTKSPCVGRLILS